MDKAEVHESIAAIIVDRGIIIIILSISRMTVKIDTIVI